MAMALDKRDKKWIGKTFKRYTDIIGEDFDSKIGILVEGNKIIKEKIDKVSKKTNATFDEVGEIKIEIAEIKLRLNKMESRLNKIESGIKQIKENVKIKNINKIKSDIVDIREELKGAPKKKEFEILKQKIIVLEKKLEKV